MVALIVVAACGGSAATPSAPTRIRGAAGRLRVVPAGPRSRSEFGVGNNRVVFGLLDPSGTKSAASPDRSLSIGYHGPSGETIPPTPTTFVWADRGREGRLRRHRRRSRAPAAGSPTSRVRRPVRHPRRVVLFDVQGHTTVVVPGDAAAVGRHADARRRRRRRNEDLDRRDPGQARSTRRPRPTRSPRRSRSSCLRDAEVLPDARPAARPSTRSSRSPRPTRT